MTATGARAAALAEVLAGAGLDEISKPPPPRLDALPAAEADALAELYRRLGGVQARPVFRPGGWDLAVRVEDEVVCIELDEELHFNRYREATIAAPWYSGVAWADDYREQCRAQEARCVQAGRWGKRWTNPSCEKMFGRAGPPGVLDGPGAPRWKQRALYDATKDLASLTGHAPRIARLSINDAVDERPLEYWLGQPGALKPGHLLELLSARITRTDKRAQGSAAASEAQ